MRKKDIIRKSKKTTKTYMKEAINYEIVVIKELPDLFITIKKYNEMDGTFSLPDYKGEIITYIDKGHYVVEITPLKENYNIRFYLDKEKRIISYYADITLFNGEEVKVPYYVDLYLDVLPCSETGVVKFAVEDELEEALANKIISK